MGVRLTARDFSLCNHYADKKSGVMNLTIWYTYGLTGLLTAMVVIQVTSDKSTSMLMDKRLGIYCL